MTRRGGTGAPTDDEVVDRLRATFRREADAVHPFSERVRAIASLEARQVQVAARRRRVAAIAAVIVLFVVAGGLVAGLRTRSRPSEVGVTGHGTERPLSGRAGQAVPSPGTTAGAPQSPKTGPSTGMPQSFVPLSVTFAPISDGWVLGTDTCGSGRCLVLAQTRDAGQTWSYIGQPLPAGINLPTLPAAASAAATRIDLNIRFAAKGFGWIYGSVGGQPVFWQTSTHGVSWLVDELPKAYAGGTIEDLETTNGMLQVAVLTEGSTNVVNLLSQNIITGYWTSSPVQLPAGSSTQLVLQNKTGWAVEDGGGTPDTAQLRTASTWSAWRNPCGSAATLLGAANLEVVAVCSSQGGETIVGSTNGGSSFGQRGTVPAGFTTQAVTATSGSVALSGVNRAGHAEILYGSGVGSAWGVAWLGGAGTQVRQIGFEDAQQGVALVAGPDGAQLLMTFDGGASWQPVNFSQH